MMHRVLVVDDDHDLAVLLGEVLTYENCEVDIAGNGMEAMDRLRTGDYDAVLCDLMMPRVDGEALYNDVVRDYPFSPIGSSSSRARRRARPASATSSGVRAILSSKSFRSTSSNSAPPFARSSCAETLGQPDTFVQLPAPFWQVERTFLPDLRSEPLDFTRLGKLAGLVLKYQRRDGGMPGDRRTTHP